MSGGTRTATLSGYAYSEQGDIIGSVSDELSGSYGPEASIVIALM